MPTSYPSGLDALTNPTAGDSMQSLSHAGQHSDANDAIEAIQTVLGINPHGGSVSVAARCAALESGKASLASSPVFAGTVSASGLGGSLLSSVSPVMDGVASAGTAVVPSRQDHVHPSDTSRAALSGATFTGDVTLSKASPAFTIAASAGNADFIWKAPAGAATRMYLQTASSARWLLQKDSSSESGSNAGSNLIIGSFTDAGATLRDDFKITRSSGRWTIGSVGASAGLEYGASGPRDMVGTGSPEGVVTAPVGSTWRDTNATTGAVKWIKASGTGNTGWVVQYGDTGWRNIIALVSSNTITNSSLRLRRVGSAVSLHSVATNSSTTAAAILAAGVLPVGFRPHITFTVAGGRDGLTAWPAHQAAIEVSSAGGVTFDSVNAENYYLLAEWTTTEAWPASLPGSAA